VAAPTVSRRPRGRRRTAPGREPGGGAGRPLGTAGARQKDFRCPGAEQLCSPTVRS